MDLKKLIPKSFKNSKTLFLDVGEFTPPIKVLNNTYVYQPQYVSLKDYENMLKYIEEIKCPICDGENNND